MYKVNDAVVYETYGVCTVSAIEVRNFGGGEREYYVLQPVRDSRSRFFVPTSNTVLTERMRPVLTADEINSLIAAMPDQELISVDDEKQRKEVCRSILSSGERSKLIALIKSLYTRRQELAGMNRKLRSFEEKSLAEAENMLYDEFAYVLGIERSEVVPYITAAIKK